MIELVVAALCIEKALITVTQKVMFKKRKKIIKTTCTTKVIIFRYFAYIYKLLLLKLYLCILLL